MLSLPFRRYILQKKGKIKVIAMILRCGRNEMLKQGKRYQFYLNTKIRLAFLIYSKSLRKKRINAKLWKHKFLQLSKSKDERCEELLDEFLHCDIRKISKNKVVRKERYSPILFCVIKNDMEKLPYFMEHYRRLGVEVFIFMDNDSTDGTREYLCGQYDTIVYNSKQEYSSARRVAWLNRLIAMYGNNKWCLIVDSDEFVNYIGSEENNLTEVIKIAKQRNFNRIQGFMLDMYSKDGLFKKNEQDSFLSTNRFFDRSSYELKGSDKGLLIHGGPRKRIFKNNMLLSKYPLFYFGKNDVIANSHYMVPVASIKSCLVGVVLCHYKFIDDADITKIKEAVKNENYASNSEDYKKYLAAIQKEESLNFYNEKESAELIDSKSLCSIKFLNNFFE